MNHFLLRLRLVTLKVALDIFKTLLNNKNNIKIIELLLPKTTLQCGVDSRELN